MARVLEIELGLALVLDRQASKVQIETCTSEHLAPKLAHPSEPEHTP
jgi:hypothetical protein